MSKAILTSASKRVTIVIAMDWFEQSHGLKIVVLKMYLHFALKLLPDARFCAVCVSVCVCVYVCVCVCMCVCVYVCVCTPRQRHSLCADGVFACGVPYVCCLSDQLRWGYTSS